VYCELKSKDKMPWTSVEPGADFGKQAFIGCLYLVDKLLNIFGLTLKYEQKNKVYSSPFASNRFIECNSL
jgi:hypothetical protein